MTYRRLILVTIACFSIGLAQGQSTDRLARIVQHLDSLVSNGDIPSYSLGVYRNGNRQFYSGGLAVVKDSIAADSLTVYEIGSITKTFTGLLTQKLISADEPVDRLNTWKLPVNQLLPAQTQLSDSIALWHLATHTSGLPKLPNNLEATDGRDPYANYSDYQLIEFLKQQNDFLPATHIPQYSNLGMGLLGYVLETASGRTYPMLLEEQIFKPLELNSAGLERNYEELVMAQGYIGKSPTQRWQFSALAAAGAIDMHTVDLLTYGQAYLDKNSPIYLSGLETTQAQITTGRRYVGYGWFGVEREDETKIFFHNGGTGGYRSTLGIDRPRDQVFTLLINSTHDLDPILAYYFGLVEELPSIEPIFKLSNADLKKYEGKFRLTPTFVMTIYEADGQLFAKATNQNALPIYPKDSTTFEFKDVKAKLIFNLNEMGEASSVTLFQNNFKQTAERID